MQQWYSCNKARPKLAKKKTKKERKKERKKKEKRGGTKEKRRLEKIWGVSWNFLLSSVDKTGTFHWLSSKESSWQCRRCEFNSWVMKIPSRRKWPKYCSFRFSISPSNEYLVLTSYKHDWFDIFFVQETLKSCLFLYPHQEAL